METDTTTMAPVEIVVSVADTFGLADGTTTPVARATLSNGAQVQVTTIGASGVPSAGANGFGPLRDGAQLVLAFAPERPVSITRLELAAWDEGDTAQLAFSNAPVQRRKRQAPQSVAITAAEQPVGEATRAGFTTYTLIAGSGADFSLKSFALVEHMPPPAMPTAPSDQLTVATPSAGESSGLSLLAIVLIAVFGGLCLCVVVGVIVCAVARRRRQQREMTTARDDEQPNLFDMETPAPKQQAESGPDEPYSSSTLQVSRSTSNYGPVTALPPGEATLSRQHMYGSMGTVRSKANDGLYDKVSETDLADESE